MKLNELLEKLDDGFYNPINHTSISPLKDAILSPQGLEFLEAVYMRGKGVTRAMQERYWSEIKSEIEGE